MPVPLKCVCGKTFDDAVGIIVARAPVPPPEDIIRAQLHSAKWYAGAEEYVGMACRTDIRIYKISDNAVQNDRNGPIENS